MLDAVLLHSRFCDMNTELTEFAHNPGYTPTNIPTRELLDKVLDFLWAAADGLVPPFDSVQPNSHGSVCVARRSLLLACITSTPFAIQAKCGIPRPRETGPWGEVAALPDGGVDVELMSQHRVFNLQYSAGAEAGN